MANLYTGEINTNGEYSSIESLTGITFENNTKYVIQITEGIYANSVYLREGTTGKGFYINTVEPITYTKGNDDLYIKTSNIVNVNIAS